MRQFNKSVVGRLSKNVSICHSEPFAPVILSEAKNLKGFRVNSVRNLHLSLGAGSGKNPCPE